MNKKPWMSLFAFLVLFCQISVAAEYKEGEVVVKYKDDSLRFVPDMNLLYSRVGVASVKYYSGIAKDFEHLILKKGVTVGKAIRELRKSPYVEYAQPNYIVRLPKSFSKPRNDDPGFKLPCYPGFETPDCDPDLCYLPGYPIPPGCKDWELPGNPGNPGNPGQRPELKDPPEEVNPPVADPDLAQAYGLEKIKATEAWKTHRGSKDMVVAVIDTGTDYNHSDLSFNLWRNPNPTQNDTVGFDFVHNDGLPFDDQGHGTHTAGTVGAVGGDGIGISGVAQRVSIMTVKFLNSAGQGQIADGIRAIEYAVKNGAKILSNSWGARGINDRALSDIITKAEEAGVLFVAAAGNDGQNNDGASPVYPASFDHENIISVAATDQNDKLAFFSNYGSTATDVAAPGVNVYSTSPGDKYATHSGTSMACPHVAGAAALIWSKNPDWDYKKVKQVIFGSVDKVAGLQEKVATGGRINVLTALRSSE